MTILTCSDKAKMLEFVIHSAPPYYTDCYLTGNRLWRIKHASTKLECPLRKLRDGQAGQYVLLITSNISCM